MMGYRPVWLPQVVFLATIVLSAASLGAQTKVYPMKLFDTEVTVINDVLAGH